MVLLTRGTEFLSEHIAVGAAWVRPKLLELHSESHRRNYREEKQHLLKDPSPRECTVVVLGDYVAL